MENVASLRNCEILSSATKASVLTVCLNVIHCRINSAAELHYTDKSWILIGTSSSVALEHYGI
jgi:hypothetical protein